MRGVIWIVVLLMPGLAAAEDVVVVDGHRIVVTDAVDGVRRLIVDGQEMLQGAEVWVQPEPIIVAGEPVMTGVAGAGGNACNAAPFVLSLKDGPRIWGPVDSCAYLEPKVQADGIVFASEPVPSDPGEVWLWTRAAGFTAAPPQDFAATAGWDALKGLAGAHPVDAMAIAPVDAALRAGLGEEYPAFAERISGLGSGDLTAEGYLGEACLKFTCDADFAVLYLHKATRQVYVIWHVYGEVKNRIFPADMTTWPPEATAALRSKVGE